MKTKLLLCASLFVSVGLRAQNAYQVQGDYNNEWGKCTPWDSKNNTKEQGTQPVGWTISNVCGINGTGATTVGCQENISDGNVAVKLTNTANPFRSSQIVPAYIALGTTWATAKASFTSVSEQDGGCFGGIEFSSRPDAVRLLYKRSHGTSAPNEPASVIAYLWTGQYSQASVPGNTTLLTSPTKVTMVDRDRNILGKTTDLGGSVTYSDGAQCIASLEYYIGGDVSEWTELIIPFTYNTIDIFPEKLNIIIAANDYFAGASSVGKDNTLYVDDVELVYNSKLASLSYNGVSVPFFDKDKAEYTITAENFDKSLLQATADGVGATVEVSEDIVNHTFTITVKGNDIAANAENYHVYTVKVNPVATEFVNPLTVCINETTTEPQETTIQLVREFDGSYSFVLNNFMLISDGSAMGIGNIRLPNLTVNGNVFTANQSITITDGDDPNVDFWMGQYLGAVPVVLTATKLSETEMVADIDIDMTASLSQVIKVVFAPSVEISESKSVDNLNGLYNIALKRRFVAGWNTVCLPFDYSVAALETYNTGVKAQAFVSADEAGLNFESVDVMKANVPYLVYFRTASDEVFYFGKQIENTTPQSITHGDFTFTGTYAAVTDMAGKYGVATIDGVDKITKGAAGSTVKGTRAYFTTSGADVQSVNLFFDGEATGIAGVEATKADTFNVYTLSGVQVRRGAQTLEGLAKGIYIVNGKKQVVK